MNHQSDHGYTTSGIQYRDFTVCLEHIRFCRKEAHRHRLTNPMHATTMRAHARGWLEEARRYRPYHKVA